MNDKIDFVVTWVDGSDPNWLKEKNKYEKELKGEKKGSSFDNNKIRYRDMECFKYWFRAIEKYASWVNKIYLVTWGHIPDWLNTNNERIVIVKHEDYIPKEYLPTFNSNVIEEFFYLIPGLSEKFVYFNDDMFITDYVKPTDFFVNNVPCDNCSLRAISCVKGNNDSFYKKLCNDMEIINEYFDFKKWKKENFRKIVTPRIGKYLLFSIPCMLYKDFLGFNVYHLPVSYLKTTFKKVWDKEEDILLQTASFKFRNNRDSVNHWLFEYWQFAEGNFIQRKSSFGRTFVINHKDIEKAIIKNKYKVICINDSLLLDNFEEKKKKIISAFEQILPDKSSFEK